MQESEKRRFWALREMTCHAGGFYSAIDADRFVLEINRHFLPDKVIAFAGSRAGDDRDLGLVPLTEGKVAIQGKPTVYICENYACRAPITELEDLRRVLSSRR